MHSARLDVHSTPSRATRVRRRMAGRGVGRARATTGATTRARDVGDARAMMSRIERRRAVARARTRARAVEIDVDVRSRTTEARAGSTVMSALAFACAAAARGGEAAKTPRALAFAALVAVATKVAVDRWFIERAHADAAVGEREAADEDGRFVNVEGVDVHYKATRKRGGAPATRVIECMHGFGANVSSWTTSGTMERLSEALDADVAAHDSCGFGLTERTRDVKRYTRSSDARACAAVLREVGVSGKSVTLVGHSLGGVSAALASAGDARVDHVVLVAPAIVGGKVTPIDKRGGAMMQLPMFARLVFACVAATLKTMSWTLLVATKPLLVVFLRSIVRSKEFWRRGLCAAIDPSRVSTMSEGWVDGYRLPKVVRDWESGMFRVVLASIAAANSPREIWRDALAAARRTTAPTTLEAEDAVNALVDSGAKILIVHGESDKIVPASNSVALAKTLGAELKLIPRCGHMPHEESCEEFVDVVRDFIVRTST